MLSEATVNERISLAMPLLDIATAKSYFQINILTPGTRTILPNKIVLENGKSFAYGWNLFQVPKKEKNFYAAHVEARRRVLEIRAVATLEPKNLTQINDGKDGRQDHWPSIDSKTTLEKKHQYSGDDSMELDNKEKLRRMRISKANSGKVPWNKGRKHSAETIQRIKERTRIAMQSPKVKMKLVNIGHAQSEETRVKIGVSVRTMWEGRRKKLMVQERCHSEWQNFIAEASRRGFSKGEELQWDSYEILDEKLKQKWLESIEQRKQMPRPKGNRRAPKSLEQRRKIAAAISAKWADPAYRDRVCAALSKYHGLPARAERQPRRPPSGESQRQPRTPRLTKKKEISKSAKIIKGGESNRTRLRRKNAPLYKDPLASSKLEMIKNIRAQRVAVGTKKFQAIEQAKRLIAEAEKAAKTLEAAALSSPLARASLSETRNLIAEAIQSIQSIEILQADSYVNDQVQTNSGGINGTRFLESNIKDFGLGEFNLKELVNGEIKDPSTSSSFDDLLNEKEKFNMPCINGHTLPHSALETKTKQTSFTEQLSHLEMNGNNKHDKAQVPNGVCFKFDKEEMNPKSITVSKKWICGRLVEVLGGDKVSVE